MLKLFSGMMRHGTGGLSEAELDALKGKLQVILDGARPGEADDDAGPSEPAGGG